MDKTASFRVGRGLPFERSVPPHPNLSPRRGSRTAPKSEAQRWDEDRSKFLPLLWGGGWGEGEWSSRIFIAHPLPMPMTNAQLSVAFFLQMFFILVVCRVVGIMARRLGQPQVVGE